MNRADRQEAAAMLRAVLAAVDRGEVAADGPVGVALVRRLQGALLALDALDDDRVGRSPVVDRRTSGASQASTGSRDV